MPIIVEPEAGQIAPPREVVSLDNRLQATVAESGLGVLLIYDASDFLDATGQAPVRAWFYRGGEALRSGAPAFAPGGVAICYDQEIGLGEPGSYSAVPVFVDGFEGEESSLSLLSANPRDRAGQPGVWLKHLADANRSAPVLVLSNSEREYPINSESATVMGSSYPIVVTQATTAPTFTLTVVTEGAEEKRRISRLLSLPGHVPDGEATSVLLLQYAAEYDRADRYVSVAGVTVNELGDTPLQGRATFEVELVTVSRPDPTDVPLRIPGRDYETIPASYTAYSDIPQTNDTYLQLALGR